MSRKLFLVFGTVATAIVVIGIAFWFFSNSPELPNNKLQYFEIVHQKQDCNPSCSVEYIIISNGIVFKRERIGNGYAPKGIIKIVRVEPEKAEALIKSAVGRVPEQLAEECINCSQFNFFSLKNGKPLNFIAREELAPSALQEIESETASLFAQGKESEQFFLQFVFKKTGKNSFDYHFFHDGTVLLTEYSGFSTKLASIKIYYLDSEKTTNLKSMVKDLFFNSESGLGNCPQNGFDMGYLEIQKGSSYNFVWTCGAEKSEADSLFNRLVAEYG